MSLHPTRIAQTRRAMSTAAKVLLSIAFALYPLLVYLFIDTVGPAAIVSILAVLLFARLALLQGRSLYLLYSAAGIATFCALAYLNEDLTVLKLYPVIVSVGLGSLCVYTLVYPPSAIERLMNAIGTEISPPAIRYARNLTGIWTLFFVFNSIVAGYTALIAPTSTWALYNGVISYVLIGLLVVLEYPVRRLYKKRHSIDEPAAAP